LPLLPLLRSADASAKSFSDLSGPRGLFGQAHSLSSRTGRVVILMRSQLQEKKDYARVDDSQYLATLSYRVVGLCEVGVFRFHVSGELRHGALTTRTDADREPPLEFLFALLQRRRTLALEFERPFLDGELLISFRKDALQPCLFRLANKLL
jgi:hypothetical protein